MYFKKKDSTIIDSLAIQSLTETLLAFTPGVMRNNDEELALYQSSLEFLHGVFGGFFEMGAEYSCVESGLSFDFFRQKGKVIENKLINFAGAKRTYVGALFALSVACLAAGRLDALGIPFEREYLIVTMADFARYYCFKSFANLDSKTSELSCGEAVYLKTGKTTMRGLVETGFRQPLSAGLDFLEKSGFDDQSLTKLFLLLVSITDDSRVILGHGLHVMSDINARAAHIFDNYSHEAAMGFDEYLQNLGVETKAASVLHSLCLFCHRLLNL